MTAPKSMSGFYTTSKIVYFVQSFLFIIDRKGSGRVNRAGGGGVKMGNKKIRKKKIQEKRDGKAVYLNPPLPEVPLPPSPPSPLPLLPLPFLSSLLSPSYFQLGQER